MNLLMYALRAHINRTHTNTSSRGQILYFIKAHVTKRPKLEEGRPSAGSHSLQKGRNQSASVGY